MKMIFAHGAERTPLSIIGGNRIVYGVIRDSLSFVFPESEDMTALDAVFTPENCAHITIVEDGGGVYIHNGYTIRQSLSKTLVEVAPATDEAEAVYENRVIVTMAQHTYTEKQVVEMQSALHALATGEG